MTEPSYRNECAVIPITAVGPAGRIHSFKRLLGIALVWLCAEVSVWLLARWLHSDPNGVTAVMFGNAVSITVALWVGAEVRRYRIAREVRRVITCSPHITPKITTPNGIGA